MNTPPSAPRLSSSAAAHKLAAALRARGVTDADVASLAVAGAGDAGGVAVWTYTVTLKDGRVVTVKIR